MAVPSRILRRDATSFAVALAPGPAAEGPAVESCSRDLDLANRGFSIMRARPSSGRSRGYGPVRLGAGLGYLAPSDESE